MPRPLNIESIFIGLRRAWYPPSAAIEASFTRLTRTLAEIYTKLGSDPDLAHVHAEIYRDFPGLTSAPAAEPSDGLQPEDRGAAGADTTMADADYSEDEAELIAAIRRWLLPDEKTDPAAPRSSPPSPAT